MIVILSVATNETHQKGIDVQSHIQNEYWAVLQVVRFCSVSLDVKMQYHPLFYLLLLKELQLSKDETLAAIAKKGIKEVSYHKRFSGDWVKRLGDGTPESTAKMQEAIDDLWPYTQELFDMTDADTAMALEGIGVDVSKLKKAYYKEVTDLFELATLEVPQSTYFSRGGKKGVHSEHMGYLLADLQYMQRTYPNMQW